MDCLTMDALADYDYPSVGGRYVEVNRNELNRIQHSERTQDTLDHCMKAYNHGPCSRMSITFNSSKGLTNAPGQNNCFLNSAVQVLWHLDAFRRSFRLLTGHSCMGNACIFCALKVMFTQFQYSDKAVLPPDTLRQAMAETFANQQRFQMGLMDDAAECFENILMRIHTHIAPHENEDTCSVPHCIPHQKFSMSVSESITCNSCGAQSDPFTYNEMVFYVSTGALVTEYKSSQMSQEKMSVSFSQLLKNTVSKGDIRACPENCGQFGVKKRNLLNKPDVVSIGLVWESAKSGLQHIRDVVSCIGTTLNLDELFHSTPFQQHGSSSVAETLQLVGVVCYYGKHYSTFFFHSKVQEWCYFDDASVKQISKNWGKVCEKLCKGRHQPLLLLYMNPRTQAVDITAAPKLKTMAPGYEWKMEEANEMSNSSPKSPPQVNGGSRPEYYSHDRKYYSDGGNSAVNPSSERQDSGYGTNLSRQDSGVSSQSSRSAFLELDSVSRISEMTKHSSDSNSSGVKELDYICSSSSYVSNGSSNLSYEDMHSNGSDCSKNFAYAQGNSYDYGHKKDKPKVSLRKKKSKDASSNLTSDVLRYHSKSQADLSASQDAYEDAVVPAPDSSTEQKSLSYATLPRKKKSAPANQVAAQVKASETNPNDTSWMKEIAKKGELLKQEDMPPQSISSRIHMFNRISDHSDTKGASTSSTKVPEIKPPLTLKTSDADPESYINRSNVEKILNKQRKATRPPVTNKMVRPVYDEQYALPVEASEKDKKLDPRSDGLDNRSIGSFKDSGYRGSNSASSVSSVSAESPTLNKSFTFDVKEHIYCEPPPISDEQDFLNAKILADADDFPPPPSDLELNCNHSKQLSEASFLSDASTLKHIKDSSIDSVDGETHPSLYPNNTHVPSAPFHPAKNRVLNDEMVMLSLSMSDSKLQSVVRTAKDYIHNSLECEGRKDMNKALLLCQQAAGLLSSVLTQRPQSKSLEQLAQTEHDSCLRRCFILQSRVNETDKLSKKSNKTNSSINGMKLKVENSQSHVREEVKCGDYVPLNAVLNRVGNTDESSSGKARHLPRTDSQTSNSSISSTGSSVRASSVNSPKPDSPSSHMLQASKQNSNVNHIQHLPPSGKTNPLKPHRAISGVNREVNIPNTLQRHGYLQDGCKSSDRAMACPSPSVIPPPREFSEFSSSKQVMGANQVAETSQVQYPNESYSRNHCHSDSYESRYQSNNRFTSNYISQEYITPNPTNQYQPTSVKPVPTAEISLPPKQSNTKQNIRDVLVDTRQKHCQDPIPHAESTYHQTYNSRGQAPVQTYHNTNNLYESKATNNYLGSSSNSQLDTPLWTPPQQSAYDRGLSHYDSPNYQKRSIYGQVNVMDTIASSYHNQPTSKLAYSQPEVNKFHQPAARTAYHCHTYSTEL